MKSSLLMLVSLLSFAVSAFAGQVKLTWDAPTATNLSGYKIYYGAGVSSAYASTLSKYTGTDASLGASPVDVGNVTEITFEISPATPTSYSFIAVAYTPDGNLGPASNQVIKTISAIDAPTNLQIE